MKYKVGDKVRIIDHRGSGWSVHGRMDKYMNTVLTIKECDGMFYCMEECPQWAWGDDDIVEKVSEVNMTKKELKSKVEELEKELAKFKKELDEKDKSPYCRRVIFQPYYSATSSGFVRREEEKMMATDQLLYKNANYFSDESFAKKVAAEQTLTNLLRKYTYEHGWSDDLWDNRSEDKYRIYYDHNHLRFEIMDNQFLEMVGTSYFIDRKTAKKAIEEIVIPFVKEHPELGYELKD